MTAVLAAVATLLVLAAHVVAAVPAGSQATSLTVSFEASTVKGVPDYLVARLTLSDGSAIDGAAVTFLRTVDLGGERSVVLGVAATDRGGIARLAVMPREKGYRVTVRFAGTDELAASEATAEIAFPAALVVHPDAAPRGGVIDPRLRPLADVMPLIIGIAVGVIWLVLLGMTGLTLRRIAAESRRGMEVAAPIGADPVGAPAGAHVGKEPVDRRMS